MLRFKKIQFFKIIEKMSFFSKNSTFYFKKGLNLDKQTELYQKNSKKRKFKNEFFFCCNDNDFKK